MSDFYAQAHEVARQRDEGASYALLAAQTGWQVKSLKSIVSRVRNGRLQPPGPRKGGWDIRQDAILSAYWETENAPQLARRLARSPAAINSRAHRLGLVKPGHRCDWWSERMEVSQ